jgi:signal transduction histidine kinase
VRSLTFKLTLAFLVVSLTGIAIVAVLVANITNTEFNRFTQDRSMADWVSAAQSYYQEKGAWTGVQEAFTENGLLRASGHPDFGKTANNTQSTNGTQQNTAGQQAIDNPPPLPYTIVDANNLVVMPLGPLKAGDTIPSDLMQTKQAITVNSQVVGYVVVINGKQNRDPLETRFLTSTTQALIFAALGGSILAVLLGLLLARTITRPVRDLTEASSAMAKGQLNQQVPVRSNDEIGVLTKTFNKMSADLEYSNHLRQQMTADIAHDLRTPISVIAGYLEGLKDGVIKPSPKRFVAMYDEVLYLQRLIEDLRTLSLADAGELSMNRQSVQPVDVVERVVTSFSNQAESMKINLAASVAENLPAVKLDPERMQQVLSNLVSNAMRFTPEGGEIAISAGLEDGRIRFDVRDNGEGMEPEVVQHVFERFYRGDSSRQEGGSGLGLAIAKSIIELQGGEISASSQGSGTGSTFTIHFPAVPEAAS